VRQAGVRTSAGQEGSGKSAVMEKNTDASNSTSSRCRVAQEARRREAVLRSRSAASARYRRAVRKQQYGINAFTMPRCRHSNVHARKSNARQ